MTGLSILAGLLTAEIVHKIGNYLDNTNEEVEKLLSGEEVSERDLRQAIKILSENPSQLEKVYQGTREALLDSGKEERKVEQALEPFKERRPVT